MKTFGAPWASDELEPTDTPVGRPCLYCEELIVEGDQGVTLPFMDTNGVREAAQHRECMIRSIVGSVGHQQGKCHCFGGTAEDPPELTKRQAAKAAMDYASKGKTDVLH